VVVDICDDHFERPAEGAHQRALIALADEVVASTPAMAESILRNTGRESIVVTDPVEGPRGEPRFEPRFPELRVVVVRPPLQSRRRLGEGRGARAARGQRAGAHPLVTQPSPELDQFVAQMNTASPGACAPRWSLVPASTLEGAAGRGPGVDSRVRTAPTRR
jgi:hypothetical protein